VGAEATTKEGEKGDFNGKKPGTTWDVTPFAKGKKLTEMEGGSQQLEKWQERAETIHL